MTTIAIIIRTRTAPPTEPPMTALMGSELYSTELGTVAVGVGDGFARCGLWPTEEVHIDQQWSCNEYNANGTRGEDVVLK